MRRESQGTVMAKKNLGIIGYDSFHYIVENIERAHTFYVDKLDFKLVARSSAALTQESGQESRVYSAGNVRVCVTAPVRQDSRAARYLRRHPSGIMNMTYRVQDLDFAQKVLEERHATLLDDPVEFEDGKGGRYRYFDIATPLGDVFFRFIERTDFKDFAPGFEDVEDDGKPSNRFGFMEIDHATSNFLTMHPMIAWLRDVLGMKQFWDVEFHTQDVQGKRDEGSGLKSIVMWDEESGVKFANNEPLRPHFDQSQITKFVYDNMGPGVQHIALTVPEIIPTIDELKKRGIDFLHTPGAYYRAMPDRLKEIKITNLKEDPKELERLEILVDGGNDRYMLQIFLRDFASYYDDERAGPFFYEIIQRAGDEGFGYGNFRALFESIEREQKAVTKAAD